MTAPISLCERRAKRDGTARDFSIGFAFGDVPQGFVLGVEIGILIVRLEARPKEWSGTYHTDNADVIQRCASAHGYACDVKTAAPGWVFVDFVRAKREPF